MIREIRNSDLPELVKIHGKFYEKEFDFPNFNNHFLCAYVVENNGIITSAAGIRTIVECIAITDKDKSVRERKEGLELILNASRYFTQRSGYDELHCFVQDENWMKQLMKKGFSKTKGNSLVLGV